MGDPQNRWFLLGKIQLKWMRTGGTPISGNLHIIPIISIIRLFHNHFSIVRSILSPDRQSVLGMSRSDWSDSQGAGLVPRWISGCQMVISLTMGRFTNQHGGLSKQNGGLISQNRELVSQHGDFTSLDSALTIQNGG